MQSPYKLPSDFRPSLEWQHLDGMLEGLLHSTHSDSPLYNKI